MGVGGAEQDAIGLNDGGAPTVAAVGLVGGFSGRAVRLAPRKNLPDSGVSSKPEWYYATAAQLFASLLHTAFASG
jgi:hypothetical protein